MIYGLIYTIPFATLDNTLCVIEIEKENYTGISTELQAADNPFTVDIEDEEFIYTPTRFSTAKISIAGSDYLQSLFSTSYREFRVTLKKDGVTTWCGYIKPELYTQDYVSENFVLEIECISAMSVLEFIDYKLAGTEKGFISIWSLLQRFVSESRGKYAGIYIPHVYAKDLSSYNLSVNPLPDMSISEQDFFDEDDKPSNLKEIIENVCKFLNWTCVDWKGDLYFLDVDHMGTYHYYDTGLTTKTDAVINELVIQNIGFAGNNHTYDRLPGYNKVTVKDSNYPVGTLLQDEDYNHLTTLRTIDNEKTDHTKVCRSVYLQPKIWDCILLKNGEIIHSKDFSKHVDELPTLEGATLCKICIYEQEKKNNVWVPKITDYSFTNTLRIRYPVTGSETEFRPGWHRVMNFKGASAMYIDGAIGISGALKITKTEDMIPFDNSAAGIGKLDIACQIRIGNKYFGNSFGDKMQGFTWNNDPNSFVILSTESCNNDGMMDWVNIPNGKTLAMPYEGLSGFIVEINEPIYGAFEFTLLSTNRKLDLAGQTVSTGCYIKDFKVEYKKKDNIIVSDNTDRTYENVVNSEYINKLDEIEFKITSYNNDGACYSKVLWNGAYLTDNLWNVLLSTTKRPEEMLITRIINHYSDTRIKLTQVIKERPDLTPITRLSDNYLVNKRFIPIGGTIDYKADKFSCIMIEKE